MNVPSAIGPYEIVRRLGRGGMAETFLALRRGSDGFKREVCLKRIYPHAAGDELMRRRFLQEAKVLSALRHSAIVMAEDAGFDPEHGHYFVMEYVAGIDLDHILTYCAEAGALFPVDAATCVIATAAEALHHGHTLAIDGVPNELVHRDVSPMNLLVDRNGYVKLIDFGISLLQGAHKFTATNMMPGNARFISPEHARRKEIEPRSDLFSLGIVAHLMLTGEHPFDDGSGDRDAIQEAIQSGAAFDPKHLDAAELLPVLSELVKQMLHPDKTQRPLSGEHIAAKLDGTYKPYAAHVKLAELATEALAHVATRDALEPSASLSTPSGSQAATRQEAARAVTTSAAKVRGKALQRVGVIATGAGLLLAIALFLGTRSSSAPPPIPSPAEGASASDVLPSASPASAALTREVQTTPPPTLAAPEGPVQAEAEAPRSANEALAQDASVAQGVGEPTAAAPRSGPLASLRVAVMAGCIVLDGRKRAADTLVARDLVPGPHTVGLAPSCKRDATEEYTIILKPGKNSATYPYAAGFAE